MTLDWMPRDNEQKNHLSFSGVESVAACILPITGWDSIAITLLIPAFMKPKSGCFGTALTPNPRKTCECNNEILTVKRWHDHAVTIKVRAVGCTKI